MAERALKLSLNTHELANEFFEGTRLLGIVAPIKDYQFCWNLNSLIGMDFRINHEIEIRLQKKRQNYFFSVFEYREPTGSLCHYLYNNEDRGEYLLPELKHLDFLWLMKDDVVDDAQIQGLFHAARSIAGVQLVVELTNEKIKHREHLIF